MACAIEFVGGLYQMSLKKNAIIGLAMGTSVAGGFTDPKGNLTNWLNELAFVPVDYRAAPGSLAPVTPASSYCPQPWSDSVRPFHLPWQARTGQRTSGRRTWAAACSTSRRMALAGPSFHTDIAAALVAIAGPSGPGRYPAGG